MAQIMSSGTLEDKISALTLVVQESPVHTMKAFENLTGLAAKKSRNHALMALSALKDLLGQGVVLPPERKLRAFAKQPGLIGALQGKTVDWRVGDDLPVGIQDVHLVSWAYEDWLKRTYFEVLKTIEHWCNDEVEFARSRATTYVWELLKEKPEQEENLLRLLINKLGDTGKKVASTASHLLLQLQAAHPAMKSIVVNAIESDLLFRPGQSMHAKYYAIITLNQTVLSGKEQEVANKLLDIYFSLFLVLLKQDKPVNAQTNGKVQGGGGKPGKKARQKAKLEEAAHKAEDQLKEKLIAQVLTGVNRAFPFAKTDDATFESQMDTIFRITHSANFNTAIQALMLIQQISASKQYTADRYYRTLYESLLDPRLMMSSKQIMYLNLLYRSLKNDISIKRVKAFVKRLLQIITLHEPPFVCGVLYLINELKASVPSIQAMLDSPEECEDDGEEVFRDVPDQADGDANTSPTREVNGGAPLNSSRAVYDGRKRDPEHSHADLSCLWELIPLQLHFHPTVSLYASRLLASEPFTKDGDSNPDPTLHTLMHFLDRFSYRSPRANAAVKTKGSSIMQPLAGAPTADLLVKDRSAGKAEESLNKEEFWMKKREEVAPDEVFFHEYFEKAGRKKARAEKRREKKEKRRQMRDKDAEEGTDEEEEEEIWKALVKSRPEIEGDLEADGGEDLDELEEFMDDDVDEKPDDGEVEFHDAPDSEDEGQAAMAADDESEGEFDAMELEDGADAFVGSDEEVPSDFEKAFEGLDAEREKTSREQPGEEGGDKKKRRKLNSLPIFASVDEYAQFLGDDDE